MMSTTVSRHLWIRITADAVIVGHPRQIKLPVSGSPKPILNGEEVAEASDGMLSWEGSTDEPDYSKQMRVNWESDIDMLIHQLSDPNTGTRENASIKLARMGEKAESIPTIARGITEYKTVGNKIAGGVDLDGASGFAPSREIIGA